MSIENDPDLLETVRAESRDIWNTNAAFWDEHMGDGDAFRETLIYPALDPLLRLQPDEQVLDIGCGNGAVARRLARAGAHVLAFDHSDRLVEHARARSVGIEDRIEYRVVDATDEAELISLGSQRFDAAVSIMVLMDIPAVQPLAAALSQLLKPGGRFVFSVTHPCFNSTGCSFLPELPLSSDTGTPTYSVRIVQYLNLQPAKALAMWGQPLPQYSFDRPLHALLRPFFEAGFVLDALEEPAFSGPSTRPSPWSWNSYSEIPPALLVRLRLLHGQPHLTD